MADQDTPRLVLLRALNTPPYDLAAGKTGSSLGEAERLIDAYREAVLRESADRPPEPELTPHSCPNCEGIDPDTCFTNPDRPPDQCSESEFDGYGLQCQKPAGHNLCTFEEAAT